MYLWLITKMIKRLARGSANQILMGRMKEKGVPEGGRFLKFEVDAILDQTWKNVDEMLPDANLESMPTKGNQLNVLLAVVTVGAYHALLEAGINKNYAIELFADIGWKLYTKFLPLPKFIAGIATRDPQKRINMIMRMFMLFPFSTPGRPGYVCKAWAEEGQFNTYWSHCPPFEFVRKFVESHGDRGEIAAYQQSWCAYDWALTYALVDGSAGNGGYYERPHTLSFGDELCDMRWCAKAPQGSEAR